MKTGPRGHWWVCSFIRMNDIVPKTQMSLLVEIVLSFATNIISYYLLKTTFVEEIMKTGTRGYWWVCRFIRINYNLVPKIQSSLLVKKNQLIPFSNDFDLHNQYFCILPPQNNIFRGNHENRPQRTLMSLLLHQDEW